MKNQNVVVRSKITTDRIEVSYYSSLFFQIVISEIYCNNTWDGILCWPDTKAGDEVIQSCPDYIHEFYYNRTYISTFFVDKGIDLCIVVALIGLDGKVIKHLLILRQLYLHLTITNKVVSSNVAYGDVCTIKSRLYLWFSPSPSSLILSK